MCEVSFNSHRVPPKNTIDRDSDLLFPIFNYGEPDLKHAFFLFFFEQPVCWKKEKLIKLSILLNLLTINININVMVVHRNQQQAHNRVLQIGAMRNQNAVASRNTNGTGCLSWMQQMKRVTQRACLWTGSCFRLIVFAAASLAQTRRGIFSEQ